MKHLRIYEEFTTNDIQVGDYVLLKNTIKFYLSSLVTTEHVKKCLEFLSNNIGVVIEIDKDEKTKNIEFVVVQYYDVDFFIKHFFMMVC